jgi:hypothetical protein
MTKVSRKNIKKPKRVRKDHPAGCRLSTEEMGFLRQHIAERTAEAGVKVSISAYTKQAILCYFGARASLKMVEALLFELGHRPASLEDIVKHLTGAMEPWRRALEVAR